MFYIYFVLILSASVSGIGQPHYECGENGRFEYCIDGIPGCIVGCHCHPGYYFDTETKICEPNAKLVQEYRRMYSGVSPTRVPEMNLPANELDLEPTPTTISYLDAHVENVANETDDLGDWLYNQFFKTIESQVINSTGTTDTPKLDTRRSNHDPTSKKKPKRRMQKKNKLSKKGKKKKTDLRRKLLRITEDDSLFESSSGSSEDSSDDSDSSSSGSSSDTSSDVDGTATTKHDRDDSHGHRKILFINKKPKPPLPSFIFLPNMETPYFSPIGLAPPPIPMYPMVPVPPMPMPPMFPPPLPPISVTPCSGNKTSETTTTPETEETEPSTTPTETTEAESTTTEKPPERSGKYFYRANGNKRGQRKKLLRDLQQMKSKMQMRKKLPELPESDNVDGLFEDDAQFRADSMPSPPTVRDAPPENVDFKYLAQLIHRMDNKTFNTKPNVTVDPNVPQRRFASNRLDNFYHVPSDNSINFERRQFDNNRHLETPDESYYSNLGHQIASLIRKIDATGDQTVNIEIERQKDTKPIYNYKPPTFEQTPFIMENSYAPRSYWERSVRSLLNRLQPADDLFDDYPPKTQEDSLFNLERKVENFATTTRSLSLNDLENVIALIDKTKSKLQKSNEILEISTKLYDENLNINLLPHPSEHSILDQKKFEYGLRPIPNSYVQKANNHSQILTRYVVNNAQNNLRGVLLHNFQPVAKIDVKNTYNSENGQHKLDMKSISAFENLVKLGHSHNLRNLPNHQPKQLIIRNVTLNRHEIANLQRIVNAEMNQVNNKRNKLPSVPWLGPKLANILIQPQIYRKSDNTAYLRPPLKMKLAPRKHSYQSDKYYVDNNNRYLHHKETVSLPLQLPGQRLHRPPQPSAYFHHEIQHLDTFDENSYKK